MSQTPSLLHIDTAYTLREVREKKHESFFLARHASGLFRRVWSVHPVADRVGSPQGKIDILHLGPNHGVVEGKVQLFRLPRPLIALNLILSQALLCRLLVRLVRRFDISVVVAVDPYISGLLGLAVARLTGRPFVLRISGNHDDLYEAAGALAMPRFLPKYRLQRAVQRFVIRRADLVTAINRNNLLFGTNNGARRTAIIPISSNVAAVHRAPPGERAPAGPLLERLGISPTGAILIYVGRLLDLKHPEDAVRAMAHNIKRVPGTIGVLAGAGPMLPALESLARELGVADSIHFVGVLDQEALSSLLPRCIMLSPSAGQLALLEGALAGMPIVAYDRDFQSEFFDDGGNGFLVGFRDREAMSRRAEQLIRDPELARRLGAAARESALMHVDPERVRQLEWEAFGSVLGGASPQLASARSSTSPPG